MSDLKENANNIFSYDFYRMTGIPYTKNIKTIIKMLMFHHLKYMYWWRKNKQKETILRRFLLYRFSRKFGLEISPHANIGKGFYLGHPYNITVAEGVKIGENVNLHKGCTIGRTNRGNAGVPKIGNKVFVGINSTIVGNITVGDDVIIAPNSYVNVDVPSHSVVIGNPAIIHYKDNATEGYVNYLV